jgi:siroheme synthase (precorrin-2 oxidase/ferrochelatase)
VGRWQTIFADRVHIAVIAIGDAEESRRIFGQSGARDILTGAAEGLHRTYGAFATPSAVAVAPDLTIASSPATGRDAIEDLIRLTVRQFDPMNDPWSRTINVA